CGHAIGVEAPRALREARAGDNRGAVDNSCLCGSIRRPRREDTTIAGWLTRRSRRESRSGDRRARRTGGAARRRAARRGRAGIRAGRGTVGRGTVVGLAGVTRGDGAAAAVGAVEAAALEDDADRIEQLAQLS